MKDCENGKGGVKIRSPQGNARYLRQMEQTPIYGGAAKNAVKSQFKKLTK